MGSKAVVRVTPGTHTFTCEAKNSAGVAAAQDFTFIITGDESDLPDDWSREYIKNALTNGFVTRIDRLDAPITRGQFAALMSTWYTWVSEDEGAYPDYEEGVVTDCGDEDYDQFLMVYLGLMDAPSGKFEPNRPLSQKEAAVIMYRVAYSADPEWFEEYGEDEILEFYFENELLSEGPEAKSDVFRENENLTNKQALVRLSMFFEALYG